MQLSLVTWLLHSSNNFPCVLWKRIIKFSPHSQGWELSSTSWYLHLEFLCKEDLSPPHPIYLFIPSFIYISMNLSIFILSFRLKFNNSFVAQIVPALAIGALSGWLLCPFHVALFTFLFSFSIFSLSDTLRCSRLILYFPCPSPSTSPKSPGPFY